MPTSMLRRLIVAIALALLLAPAIPASAAPRTRPARHPARHHRHPAPKPKKPKPVAPVVAPAAPATPTACVDTDLIPAPDNVSRVAAATLCLLNNQRAGAGLTALRANGALSAAATQHSLDMVAENYLAHVSPSGGGPLERVRASGYLSKANGYSLAEDITAAIGDQATPAATVGVWMSSPEFRGNVLSPVYRDIGIGVAAAVPPLDGTDPGATYTGVFAAAG